MKKTFSVYILLICITLIIFSGCKGKDQDKSQKGENKAPQALEDVQTLSDEVVKAAMIKDWPTSLSKAKELQTKWNELYADLQKKGISETNVDSFIKDINKLSDALISKTMTMPKTEVTKTEGGQQQLQQQQGNQQNQQQGDQQNQQQGSQQQGSQQQGNQQQGQQQTEIQPSKSQKILDEVDPTLSASEEELSIINDSIELMSSIPTFMGMYGGTVPADIYKLKYYVYHISITSKMGNWDEAITSINKMMEIWDNMELKISKIDEEQAIQIKQSLKELNTVVEERSLRLIGLKSNNAIEYIESAIKSFEEQEDKSSEQENK